MKRNLSKDVQQIILDFIGITDYSKGDYCRLSNQKGRRCKTKPMSGFRFCRTHQKIWKDITNRDGFKKIAIDCCRAFTKKGKKCKIKAISGFIFCGKHKQLIQKLANGDGFKEIAIAYLLMCYKGPNRKKISSKGIDITKKVKEAPLWVGRCNNDFFFTTRYCWKEDERRKLKGFCICPWCIEEYFKFFPRYQDRILMIKNCMEINSYPFKSYIELFNNNIVKIDETAREIKAKRYSYYRGKTKPWSYGEIIPTKRLINQYYPIDGLNGSTTNPLSARYKINPLSMVKRSYFDCANNTKLGFKENGFDDIIETQYIYETEYNKIDTRSRNYFRLKKNRYLVSFSSYEVAKIGLIKKLLLNLVVFSPKGKGLVPEKDEVIRIELPDDIIRLICSFFYDKKTFKKSFLKKKRIFYWRFDNKKNKYMKVDDFLQPIYPIRWGWDW